MTLWRRLAITLALSLVPALVACSGGDDLDLASGTAPGTGGLGGAGGQGTAGGAVAGSGGAMVTNPGCAPAGAAAVLGQGTARLDLDAVAQSTWDLEDGMFGQIVQDGEVRNRDSHLDYGRQPNTLSVAVQGGEKGAILQLGTNEEVAARLSAQAPCTGFDSLALVGGAFTDPQAATLYQTTPQPTAGVTAVAGNVYVLRVVRGEKSEIVAKLLVTAVDAKTVSFSWARLAPP